MSIAGFQCSVTPFKLDQNKTTSFSGSFPWPVGGTGPKAREKTLGTRLQNKKLKTFNRLSPESGNRKKVDSPRFRSQQFFLWKIYGEAFSPDL